jgi:hypothetical protein
VHLLAAALFCVEMVIAGLPMEEFSGFRYFKSLAD